MKPLANKIPIIVVLGPTASGKTSLAIHLAKKLNGEIISADSRQVYVGMDIGTGKEGKPDIIKLKKVGRQPVRIIDHIPQYLVDLEPPTQTFTVSDFQKLAQKIIDDITSRNKIPIIVGGTHFYITALVEGYLIPPADPQELELRRQLEELPEDYLLKKLEKLDPKSFDKIDHHNRRRLIRALSATIYTGKPFSRLQKKTPTPYRPLYIGIKLSRSDLYQKIDQRVDDRLKVGMIEEVKKLLGEGVEPEKLISFGLEYKFITQYLIGNFKSKDEMIAKLKFAIHAFARRQYTWIHKKIPVIWVSDKVEAENLAKRFLDRSISHLKK